MITKRIVLAFVATGVTAILIMALGAWSSLSAAGSPGQQLEGSWIATVTPTGEGALPPFLDLITFTTDGGVMGAGGLTAFHSSQHGEWVRTGDREFAFTFVFLTFDENGTPTGTAKVRITATLNETLDEANGPFQAEIFDPSGNVVFAFSGTFQATRIGVEPLQ